MIQGQTHWEASSRQCATAAFRRGCVEKEAEEEEEEEAGQRTGSNLEQCVCPKVSKAYVRSTIAYGGRSPVRSTCQRGLVPRRQPPKIGTPHLTLWTPLRAFSQKDELMFANSPCAKNCQLGTPGLKRSLSHSTAQGFDYMCRAMHDFHQPTHVSYFSTGRVHNHFQPWHSQ